MSKGTDKIDLLSVGGELTQRQKEIAIAIWHKIGCFNTVSDQAHTQKRFREENVMAKTFHNYTIIDYNNFTPEESHYNKMVRLMKQVIDYYRGPYTEGKGVNKIARIYYSGKKREYTLICKPNKVERLRGFNFRTSDAAAKINNADKMQKADTKTMPINAIALTINKVCAKRELADRPALLKEFINAAQEKLIEVTTTIALLESSEKLKDDLANGTDHIDKEKDKDLPNLFD